MTTPISNEDGQISKTPGTDALRPAKPVGEGPQKEGQGSFKAAMQGAKAPESASPLNSPMELAQNQTINQGAITFDSLANQARSNQKSIEGLQNLLQTPNLKLRQGEKNVLRNKLEEAHNAWNAVSEKFGHAPAEMPKGKGSLLGKFLDILSTGQRQMDSAQQDLIHMKTTNGKFNPGDFLLIQLKLAKAQQNVEYSSVLLSKAVETIRTMMNVQL